MALSTVFANLKNEFLILKILSTTIIVFSVFLITGCDDVNYLSPREVITRHLDAGFNNNWEEYYQYLSLEDKNIKSLDKFKKEKEANSFAQGLRSAMTYKILEITETGNTAKVEVEYILGSIRKNNEIILTKEKNGWKVLLGWEAINSNNNKKNVLTKEKQSYLKNITVYGLEAKYYDNYLSGKVAGTVFKLKNAGNKVIEEIKVTIYFKDNQGNTIHEKVFRPIIRGDTPLKSGYIWQNEKNSFFKDEAMPSEWKEGAVSAKINSIEFLE